MTPSVFPGTPTLLLREREREREGGREGGGEGREGEGERKSLVTCLILSPPSPYVCFDVHSTFLHFSIHSDVHRNRLSLGVVVMDEYSMLCYGRARSKPSEGAWLGKYTSRVVTYSASLLTIPALLLLVLHDDGDRTSPARRVHQ